MRIFDFPRDSRNRSKAAQVAGINSIAQKVMNDVGENESAEAEMGESPVAVAAENKTKKETKAKKKKKASVC